MSDPIPVIFLAFANEQAKTEETHGYCAACPRG